MGARSRIAVVVALSGALLLGGVHSPASAASWDEVEFVGSGWGHGVGLSQYGALALAVMGEGYDEILTHYFKGTSISTVNPATSIWVNLERDFSTLTLSVLDIGAPGTGSSVNVTSDSGAATAAPGATIHLNLMGDDGCSVDVANPDAAPVTITDTGNCAVDFSWYQWSSGEVTPKTKIQINGCTLADRNVNPIVQRPCQYARGQLHLRHGPGGLDLSAEMRIDDYILGISEVPFNWNMEALKAQAVAARSYAEGRRRDRIDRRPTVCWCHVMDSTADQRYVGWGHSNVANWVNATQSTANEILTHPDSSKGVITTFYSSSSGGATEFGHEKGFANGPVQWLSSVDDSWAVDGTVSNPNASWSKTVSTATIASLLGWDHLSSIKVTKRRPGSNSVAEIRVTGTDGGNAVVSTQTGSWARLNLGLKSEYFSVNFQVVPGDELLLYKSNGSFRYEDLNPDGTLGAPILTGSGYTKNWKSITSIDLDGDSQDEIMFYREDGLFRYYEIGANGHVGAPILAGDGYTKGWDSITAVDLDGDGQDEIFFYRDDGLFRYYEISPSGHVGSPILAGDGYTKGWDSITAVDLDGDGQDEMFFYREDGLYRYYDIKPSGHIGSPILAGSGYTKGWDAITAVDLEGDGQDEMFFYREDGLFRFYDIRPNATLGSPIRSGNDFSTGWSVITSIDLDGQ